MDKGGEERIDRVIATIIGRELDVDVMTVLSADSLRAEFGMDSVAAAGILFAIEEEFDISFERYELGKMQTVRDLRRALLSVIDRK